MKNNKFLLLLIAFLAASCSGRGQFDRVVTTPIERYSIVYKDSKCGVYDNQGDSLVIDVKFNAIKYCGIERGKDGDLFMFVGSMDDCDGILGISKTTSKATEVMFPRNQSGEK